MLYRELQQQATYWLPFVEIRVRQSCARYRWHGVHIRRLLESSTPGQRPAFADIWSPSQEVQLYPHISLVQ